jgi:hypothetical protein
MSACGLAAHRPQPLRKQTADATYIHAKHRGVVSSQSGGWRRRLLLLSGFRGLLLLLFDAEREREKEEKRFKNNRALMNSLSLSLSLSPYIGGSLSDVSRSI